MMVQQRKRGANAPNCMMTAGKVFIMFILGAASMYALVSNSGSNITINYTLQNVEKEQQREQEQPQSNNYLPSFLPIGSMMANTNDISMTDPDGSDCSDVLAKFRRDEIDVAKDVIDNQGDESISYRRSYVTISNTEKPFYIATHDAKIDGVRAGIMKYQGYYESELTKRVVEIFETKAQQGQQSIFLDVGANIGWFSLLAAAHGASRVYSFEPNLQNTIRFCESLSLNHWLHNQNTVIPVTKGAGNQSQQLPMYAVNEFNPGSFTFNYDSAKWFKTGKMNGTKAIYDKKVIGIMEITTLDEFAERHHWLDSRPSIGLFKLDVEHYETEVLQGATKLLQSHIIENIVFELDPKQSKDAKSNIVRMLMEAGYELYMHGGYKGPSDIVSQKYKNWEDLIIAIHDENKYNRNLMFRIGQE